MITQERLKELLDYDPRTGIFTWKVCRGGGAPAVGGIAGSISNYGYRRIKADGKLYLASHLAWLWVKGEWPVAEVDHRDGNRADDRWSNLRPASHGQNMRNRRACKNSASGLKGVFPNSSGRTWMARVWVEGKSVYLGCFATKEAAKQAYDEAATRLHGEFFSDGR